MPRYNIAAFLGGIFLIFPLFCFILNAPVHKVPGNHDFSVEEEFKRKVRKKLDNKRGYYDFTIGNYNFIVTDGTDLCTLSNKEGKKKYNKEKRGKSLLFINKRGVDNSLYFFGTAFALL